MGAGNYTMAELRAGRLLTRSRRNGTTAEVAYPVEGLIAGDMNQYISGNRLVRCASEESNCLNICRFFRWSWNLLTLARRSKGYMASAS